MADSRTPVERGIHAASPSEFFEPLEIPPTSHFAALKRRKRRAPGAFLNQPCFNPRDAVCGLPSDKEWILLLGVCFACLARW